MHFNIAYVKDTGLRIFRRVFIFSFRGLQITYESKIQFDNPKAFKWAKKVKFVQHYGVSELLDATLCSEED